jgi:predicted dehydrogenase
VTILIIGLGSMGKRRIRCLQALGYTDIIGYDWRQDRCMECGVPASIGIPLQQFSHVFICTPPATHAEYADQFRYMPCFVEAGTDSLSYGTPSDSMWFNPAVIELRDKLPSLGKIINISYHCGQYLPDWHPYEPVDGYYVSETGAIEMVAFELMWFTKLFGFPEHNARCIGRNARIEGLRAPDTVAILFNNPISTLIIDVVARAPVRQLIVNGMEGSLSLDLNSGVSEQMYIDETKAFMAGEYPNTLEHNNRVIEMVEGICG